MRFEFATTGRVLFGPGAIREAGATISALGSRVMVVTGQAWERAEPLLAELRVKRLDTVILSVDREPDVDFVRMGTELAGSEAVDVVVGFGGGSAIDAGKAIAALATNSGDPLDYLEVVGRGLPLAAAPLPFVAIPTTAGTGAEATRNAVLAVPGARVKASLRSSLMLPRVAIVDPELTVHLPPAVTASTGLDALTQLVEPYLSVRANPITDALCLEGIARVARSLRRAWADGHDADARADMALAALLGGMALANAGLGAVHGIAAPVGGAFPAPHGAICAALLPHAFDANLAALRDRARGSEALLRADRLGELLAGRRDAGAASAWLHDTCATLEIPPLSAYGLTKTHLAGIAGQALVSSSMKGNPVALTADEVEGIIRAAL